MSTPRLPKRDLASLDLSVEARQDVERLGEIRRSTDRYKRLVSALNKERLGIWRRHLAAGDLRPAELARLSGVTAPFVTREAKGK